MPGLKRTGLIADDFFLMVHDDISGHPRLPDRIFGLGLASALLCELAVVGAIDVEDDAVTAATAWKPPTSPLADEVLREIVDERHRRPVRDWLNYLATQTTERVAERMAAEGLVYRKPSRLKFLGVADRWTPMDTATAGWPAIDVKLKVFNGHADSHHLVLFGLTRATGLRNPSLFEVQSQLEDPVALEETLEPLGYGTPLLDLLAHTEAAVGSAVASQRIR